MDTSRVRAVDEKFLEQFCCFVPNLAAPDRDGALASLVAALGSAYPVIPEREILNSVLARERLRATSTPEGVAFPHGKHPLIHGLYAAVATTATDIAFGGEDRMPCRILVLTASSAYSTDSHLHFLACMAQQLRFAAVRNAVLAAQNKNAFMQAMSLD